MLDEKQIKWIIKAKNEGCKNDDIAHAQEISVRRVQQLYSSYKKTGSMPILKKLGRPRAPEVTEDERSIIIIKDAHERFRMCACYLAQVLSSYGIRINHNRIHRVLKEEEGGTGCERAKEAEEEEEVDKV